MIPYSRGRQHTILPKFSKNLHEIEKFVRPCGEGGAAQGVPPLDPPLERNNQRHILHN